MQETAPAVEWRTSPGLVPYPEALRAMEERAAAIRDLGARELVWLLEHPPLYTAGTSADPGELLDAARFPVFSAGRGGRYTYHGPGQRIVYVMLDLKRRGGDIRRYVHDLEELAIRTLAAFGVRGERREGRVGIWVVRPEGEAKIGAIGVRVRRWVSYHGLALNLRPDLTHFQGIVPCGISEYGVTSLEALGVRVELAELDAALRRSFADLFEKE
ncbi:MAG: lipoyl(octanoyl) transferase LipB [Geminicoccaceae bacterium]